MKLVPMLSALALAACATSPRAPNSVDGPGLGKSLVIAEAVWWVAPFNTTEAQEKGQAAYVLMSTEPNLCDRAVANTVIPGENFVGLSMIDIAGTVTSAPSAPGDYTVPIESYWAPKTAWLGSDTYDAQCTHTSGGFARSGTITISSVDASNFIGSFAVSISTAGAGDLSGTFTPQPCPGLANVPQGKLPACQPL